MCREEAARTPEPGLFMTYFSMLLLLIQPFNIDTTIFTEIAFTSFAASIIIFVKSKSVAPWQKWRRQRQGTFLDSFIGTAAPFPRLRTETNNNQY